MYTLEMMRRDSKRSKREARKRAWLRLRASAMQFFSALLPFSSASILLAVTVASATPLIYG
jgi:hypothetical protein